MSTTEHNDRPSLWWPFFVTALCACTQAQEIDAQHEDITASDGALTLALVNHPDTDLALLDEVVGLDRRAAQAIVARRDGGDALYPSDDDRPFATLAELDAVPYVGTSAFDKMIGYVQSHELAPLIDAEGVVFSSAQAAAVVWGVNQASLAELDETVALNGQAASRLVASAPYDSVAAVASVPYVGTSALRTLRAYAPSWAEAQAGELDLAGTFDDVAFDQATAAIALAIANEAQLWQLTELGHLYTPAAEAIAGARPYESLAEVAAVKGVGTGTMKALHGYATSGLWPDGGACPEQPSFTPEANASIDGYHDAIQAFDSSEPKRFSLAAFELPACFDPQDPQAVEALRQLVIDHAGWGYVVAEFPQLLEYHPIGEGPGQFSGLLGQSITFAQDWRNEKIQDGDETAAASYQAIEMLYGQIDALVTAHPSRVHSLRIYLDASECSQDAAAAIDLEAGWAFVIHKNQGC